MEKYFMNSKVIASTQEGYWRVDPEARTLEVNDALCLMLGYDRSELIGRTSYDFVDEENRAILVEQSTASTETDQRHYEIAFKAKDGAVVHTSFNATTLRDCDGRIIGSFAFLTDVTDRKIAEKQLSEAKDEAERANKAKSEFLASMSHELRTPLNAILGFAQLMQIDPRNSLSPTQNDHVENILTGGNHLLELVNDILDLASIEADRAPFTLEETNANELVAECVVLTRPLGKPRGIQIIDNFSPGPAVVVRTDQRRFKQMILNLLSNAVKFNNEGGTVTLDGYETDDGFLCLSVRDTGIGIAKNDQCGLFQIFHRLDADAAIAKEGSGVGLYVTKLLVERLAGQIGFESEEGLGSTFWLKLPLASNQETMIWNENLRVGVDAIDKDHQVLASLLNKVKHRSVSDADVDEIVGELIDYTRYHFRREEMVMEVCGYPDLDKHRGIHQDLTNRVNDLADAWREDRDPKILHRLRKFLRQWLANHIMQVDTEIAAYTNGKEQDIRNALERLNYAGGA